MKSDTVILFDTYGSADSRLHSVFLYHLEVSISAWFRPGKLTSVIQHNLKAKGSGMPYEFRYVRLKPWNVRGIVSTSHHPPAAWWPGIPDRNFPLRHANDRPRALESILLSVLSALEAEMVFIRNLVGGLLAELEDDIDRDKFKRLLHYSRRLVSFRNRAKLVRLRRPENSFINLIIYHR